jgi:Holliday junction resolvasome RuvABC endonuclease subunit
MTALGFTVKTAQQRLLAVAFRCDLVDGNEVVAKAFEEKSQAGVALDVQLAELAASLETRLKTLKPTTIGVRTIESSGQMKRAVAHQHGLVEGVILAVGNRAGASCHLYTLNQVAAALDVDPAAVKAEGLEAATARAALRRSL